ncbi:Calnexin [Porphyridium purpureum]|uniref:Calnexin n=1 Tax=Porphyridium purpureum TaxID=35688 RepID=A0A5J4YZB4_PORPP|nr:Calnexin [Porphyridium purpureum]|eukprot:POR2616..scf209_3
MLVAPMSRARAWQCVLRIAAVASACGFCAAGRWDLSKKPENGAVPFYTMPVVEPPAHAYLWEDFQQYKTSFFQVKPGDTEATSWMYARGRGADGAPEIGSIDPLWYRVDKGIGFRKRQRQHYKVARKLDIDTIPDGFTIQFDVRCKAFWTCSGLFWKLLAAPLNSVQDFKDTSPSSIVFGPDRCNEKSRVLVIITTKNPVSGEYEEHVLQNAPEPHNHVYKATNLYRLSLFFERGEAVVAVNDKEYVYSLDNDFEPPFQPRKMVDDPADSKPSDWVDEREIVDLDDRQPDDWDETQEPWIPDTSVQKPDDWLEEENAFMKDPNVRKPDFWDDEEDGPWQESWITNPLCLTGKCGTWHQPQIPNPNFRGKWKPRMIPNPDFKGEWQPRKIPNPTYYEIDSVQSVMLPVAGVALDVLVSDYNIWFDNLYVGRSDSEAKYLAEETSKKKQFYETYFEAYPPTVDSEGIPLKEKPWQEMRTHDSQKGAAETAAKDEL